MKMYESQRNGKRAKLISQTMVGVLLEMEDTGENKEFTEATFKRWWKPVEDTPAAEGIQAYAEAVAAPAGTPLKVAGEEPEEAPVVEPKTKPTKKAKAEKAPKAPKAPKAEKVKKPANGAALRAYIESAATMLGCTLYSGKVTTFVSLKVDGRAAMAFTYNRAGVTLWARRDACQFVSPVELKEHTFGGRVKLDELNEDTKAAINYVLGASIDYLAAHPKKD